MIASGLMAAVLTLTPAFAEAPQDGLVDRNRLDRSQSLPDQRAAVGVPGEAAAAEPDIAPFVLQRVDIRTPDGVRPPIEDAVRPFVGQTLDGAGVARLRAAVSTALGEIAALPVVSVDVEEASSGVVRVTAAAGRIGRVAIYGDTGQGVALMQAYAARMAAEAPLTRRTSERYLSLIADIPGASTTLETVRSATPGATDVGLDVAFRRWAAETTIDNRGSSTLGRTQITGALTLNGGLRFGDQTRIALTLPDDPDRFQYLTFSHRQPVGTDGAAITLTAGRLRTRIEGLAGDATSLGLVGSWPMIRGYRSNLILSAGLDALDSDNAVFGNLVATEQTRAARASLAYGRIWPRATVNASVTLSQGIDGLGSEVNAFTDADFAKVNGRVDVVRALGRSWRLTGSLAAQYSDDRAPTAELFSLGGADFGRGFGSGLLVGDSGYAAKVEAAWRPAFVPAVTQGSELYAFADGGEAQVNGRAGLPSRSDSLMSAGAGVRIALGRKLVVEVEAARAVDDPRPNGSRSRLGVGLTARF